MIELILYLNLEFEVNTIKLNLILFNKILGFYFNNYQKN